MINKRLINKDDLPYSLVPRDYLENLLLKNKIYLSQKAWDYAGGLFALLSNDCKQKLMDIS